MKKICFITGTRADYGLIKPVMQKFKNSNDFKICVVVTGMHLSHEFGYTIDEIKNDNFIIHQEVETLLSSDTTVGISKSFSLGVLSFSEYFNNIKPNLIFVLGDRYEIFAACVAAMFANIPIAHHSGGELTEGSYDEQIRHSITKMSHIHFVAAEEYKNRVIQLGENPSSVHNVGGLGVENINSIKYETKTTLQKKLGLKFKEKNLLITYHPETLNPNKAENQILELINTLVTLKNTLLIFTMPNADKESKQIYKKLENFSNNENVKIYKSLGYINYLSCLKYVDAVLGNSSSGLTEAPSFKIGTINVGDRQKGRLKATSIIDCDLSKKSILYSIDKLYSHSFQKVLKNTQNPYSGTDTSLKIYKIIKKTNLKKLINKSFYDLH